MLVALSTHSPQLVFSRRAQPSSVSDMVTSLQFVKKPAGSYAVKIVQPTALLQVLQQVLCFWGCSVSDGKCDTVCSVARQ